MTTAPLDRSAERIVAKPATMRAVIQTRYGTSPADVLSVELVPTPVAGDDEVIVEIRASSVDRGTWHLMSGLPYPIRLGAGLVRPKALNPGRSLAGTVASVGRNVTKYHPGDTVYGFATAAFAQFACANVKKLAPKPTSVTFEQAAAAPVSGMTALKAVRDKAEVKAGERVLVIGASGGVGSFAVQIAASLGATVTAVCSGAKADFVRSLGATHVIDYTSEIFASDPTRYDAIIEVAGNSSLSDLRRSLTPRGRLVMVGGESDARWIWPTAGRQLRCALMTPFVRQRLTSLMALENAKDLDDLRELIDTGAVTPAVDEVMTLDETPLAMRRLIEGHARGKVVIRVVAGTPASKDRS